MIIVTKSNSIRYFFLVFKIFGLSTISLQFKRSAKIQFDNYPYFKTSWPAVLYDLLLAPTIVMLNFFSMRTSYLFVYKKKINFFRFMDFFEINFGTFTSVVLLISYSMQRNIMIELSMKTIRLSSMINQLRTNDRKSLHDHSTTFLFIFYTFVALSLLCSALALGKIQSCLGTDARNLVITGVLLQYTIVVKTLCNMFQKINQTLLSLMKISSTEVLHQKRISYSVLTRTKKLQVISSLRDFHQNLLELSREIIDFYKIKILGCISHTFICFVVFAYFLIALIIEMELTFTSFEYAHLFLWLVLYASSFAAVTHCVTNIMNEVR